MLAFEAPDPIEKSVPKAHNHGDDTTCDSMKADYETTIQTLKKSLHDAEKEIKHLKAEIESPANPAEAEIHRLQTEIDKLYRQERKRQQRVQHQDADTKDNGPKEISIFCKDVRKLSVVLYEYYRLVYAEDYAATSGFNHRLGRRTTRQRRVHVRIMQILYLQ